MSNPITTLTEFFKAGFDKQGLAGRAVDELITEFAETVPALVNSELITRLHETEKHPDWQYESIEHPRKASYSNPPEGAGWMDNVENDRGCTRYDNTEYHHFRRLKTDAAKDEVDPWNLPTITLSKVDASAIVEHVRGSLPPSVIAGGQYERMIFATDFSKYQKELITIPKDMFGGIMTGLFYFKNDIQVVFEFDATWPFMPEEREQTALPYLLLCLPGHPYRLLIDCMDPDTKVWISVERKDHSSCNWRELLGHTPLPIDLSVLNKELASLYG